MQKLRVSSLIVLGFTSMGLVACEKNVTKSELHEQISGIYGVNSNCVPVARGQDAPKGKYKPLLTVMDNYEIDDGRICRLEKIVKKGNGFLLSSQNCRNNMEKVSDNRWVSDVAQPFELRVEAIDKNTVIFQEKGKEPVTVYRCGSNLLSKIPKPPKPPSKRQ